MSMNKKTTGWIVVIVAVFMLIGLSTGSTPPIPKGDNPSSPTKTNYKILDRTNTSSVENISVLVSPDINGEKVAKEVKKTCRKPCNISIYDNEKAFELQEEYDTKAGDSSTDLSWFDEWKKNNYVFVADHQIGYMMFESDDYDEYPLRDWYYKELKAK